MSGFFQWLGPWRAHQGSASWPALAGARAGMALACLIAALVVTACAGSSTLRIVNRTQVPVLALAGDSSLLVGACAERTVGMSAGVWGGDGVSSQPHVEEAPPGAYVLRLPGSAVTPPFEGSSDYRSVVVITQGYIGYTYANYGPYTIAGTGTFPPDLSAVECAGSPPLQPSPSPVPGP